MRGRCPNYFFIWNHAPSALTTMSHVGKKNYPLDDASMARTATDLSGPRAFGGGDKKPAADLRGSRDFGGGDFFIWNQTPSALTTMSHVGKKICPLDDASMARTVADLSGSRAFGGGEKISSRPKGL
jgi:hypothetical protein